MIKHNALSTFCNFLSSKSTLILFTWLLAFAISYAFRALGASHPEPFNISYPLIYGLLFGPSLLLGVWIFASGRDAS
tara:strand:+ start:582 stop:812 length:231 start_codon:yes stop_codon:yes gene_type:complete